MKIQTRTVVVKCPHCAAPIEVEVEVPQAPQKSQWPKTIERILRDENFIIVLIIAVMAVGGWLAS